MKDLRWLFLLVVMALLVSCDVTRAAAPLVVNLPQSTPLPHDPPAAPQVIVKRELIPPGLRVEGLVYPLVLSRFYKLAYIYPDVAKRTQRIVARRLPKAWVISYEAKVIYVNVWYGEYVIADKLTEQFARRAYDHLRKHQPGTAKSFRTAKVFAAWLASGVR